MLLTRRAVTAAEAAEKPAVVVPDAAPEDDTGTGGALGRSHKLPGRR